MSLQYSIEDASRLVVMTGQDDPALDAALDTVTPLLRDAQRCHGYGLLILVAPEAPSPSGTEIHVIGQLLQMVLRALAGPAAIVARGETQATAAILIALSVDADVKAVESFQDEPSARAWLASQLRV